jgi:hypothetical protein
VSVGLYMDVHVPARSLTLGQCVADLELIANVGEPADLAKRIYYLPLR